MASALGPVFRPLLRPALRPVLGLAMVLTVSLAGPPAKAETLFEALASAYADRKSVV